MLAQLVYTHKGKTNITSTTTNESGEYSFSKMDPGWYSVYSSKSGYIDEQFLGLFLRRHR